MNTSLNGFYVIKLTLKGVAQMTFNVGETVVYPNHGAAVIEDIETRTIKGE